MFSKWGIFLGFDCLFFLIFFIRFKVSLLVEDSDMGYEDGGYEDGGDSAFIWFFENPSFIFVFPARFFHFASSNFVFPNIFFVSSMIIYYKG